MGRYSRKDMIEFANFAKSYQSSRNVEQAYAAYLSGVRLVSKESVYEKMLKSNLVFLNDKIIKNRYGKEDMITTAADIRDAVVESWDENTRTLYLITK